MLAKIESVDYSAIKAIHRDLIVTYPLINAVVTNLQDGFVYADSSKIAFLVSTKSGFALCNPGPDEDGDQQMFGFLQRNRAIPPYLHLYNPVPSLRDYVERNWPNHKIRSRAQFRGYEMSLSSNYEKLLPSGYRIATIQELGVDRLDEVFRLDLGHRYWNSKQSFENEAIGACLVDENGNPVAICYSACVVEGVAEIDTLVLPEYRQ